jgi:hypothetical protein
MKSIIFLSLMTLAFAEQDISRVYQHDIRDIFFKSSEPTNSRRIAPVPQTLCVKGCHLVDKLPDGIRCNNTRLIGKHGIRWKCGTNGLSENVMFEPLGVSCEGYENHFDSHILNNSCQIRYRLKKSAATKSVKSSKGNSPNSVYDIVLYVLTVAALMFIFENSPGSLFLIGGGYILSAFLSTSGGTWDCDGDSDDEYCGTFNR